MKIDDIGEVQMAVSIAEGAPVAKDDFRRTKSETARYHDNSILTGSAGEFVGKWKNITVYQGRDRLAPFGRKCRKVFGDRFTLEEWTYEGRKPKLKKSYAFDAKDKAGTAIGEPPPAIFAGFFGLTEAGARHWVKGEAEAVKKAIADDMEGEI